MEPTDTGLAAEDLAYRRGAEAYFLEKGPLARDSFDPRMLGTFQRFQEHWQDFFAPAEPVQRTEYLTTPFEVRRAQFERFRRECRAWEVNFRIFTNASRQARPSDSRREELKRRLDQQRDKADRVRAFYDNLDSMMNQAQQRRAVPMQLLPHLRALGLSSDATLEDVKRQYKRLAKLHHPDRQGDPLEMSRVIDAYRALVSHLGNGNGNGTRHGNGNDA